MKLEKGMYVYSKTPVGEIQAVGQVGVVLYASTDDVCVEFNQHIDGHNGNHSKVRGKHGHCWWVSADYLTPVRLDNNQAVAFLLKEEW